MDTLLCMPFSSMVKVGSITSTIGKGPVIFGITFLSVAVDILSALHVVDANSAGFSM